MRPPEFWSGQASGRDTAPMLQALLAPIGALYGWAAALHQRQEGARVSVPVICVGNLTLGGAGKTPVARHVRGLLGEGAFVLLRGYGGDSPRPMRVTARTTFREAGDEAMLHAQDGPTIVARNRAAGAALAIGEGARAVVMDDGFQNPSLKKDFSLVVIDAAAGIGNGRVFPAGPLRAPLKAGLARGDAFVLMGAGETPAWLEGRTVLRAHAAPLGAPPAGPLIAFAGIARPEKFFDTLAALGAEIAEAVPFSDHYPFSERDLAWLETLARERGARLITTEKDLVRIDPARRAAIATLPVQARFDDEGALARLLAPIKERMG